RRAGKSFADAFSKNANIGKMSFRDSSKESGSAGSKAGRAFTKSFGDNIDVDELVEKEMTRIKAQIDREHKRWWSQGVDLTRRGLLAIGVVIGASAPYLGGLLAAGIVTAFGGGLAALSLVVAYRSEKVKKRFIKLREDIGKEFKEINKPMEDAFVSVMDSAEDL